MEQPYELERCEECGCAFSYHTEDCYHSDCDEDDSTLHGCKGEVQL